MNTKDYSWTDCIVTWQDHSGGWTYINIYIERKGREGYPIISLAKKKFYHTVLTWHGIISEGGEDEKKKHKTKLLQFNKTIKNLCKEWINYL